MKLILVRHGRTRENEEGIVQGHISSVLSSQGIEDVKKTAEELASFDIDVIYCSDLERAKQTAEIIAEKHPEARIEFKKVLRERHYGKYEGKKKSECWPADLAKSDWDAPGGESWADVIARASEFINELKEKHMLDTILVVSHSGFLHVLEPMLLGGDYKESLKKEWKNSSYIIIEVGRYSAHRVSGPDLADS